MPEQVVDQARRRGGNRLPVGHPARGRPPVYKRCRVLAADREPWRGKRQRERTRRAMGWAVGRGELPARLVPVLETMLEQSDETCGVIRHKLATIGKIAGGWQPRTVGGWLAELHKLGWVQKQHRFVVDKETGLVRATSNLWRIDIPEHLRVELAQAETTKSADTRRRRQKKGRVTPPGGPARQGPRRGGHAQGTDFTAALSTTEADELAATDAAVQDDNRTRRPDDPAKQATAKRMADEIRAQVPPTTAAKWRARREGRSPP